MKIEINSEVDVDSITNALQESMSTKQLVDFVIGLSDNLTEDVEYIKLLKQKVDKIVKDYEN
jgi:inorganic pyrophosphatase/exopolyphosphatase